ncbi:MAG: DUF4435 domain-containing protein [Pseudomonadota bacterium]
MARTGFNGALLLVEGNDDSRFFKSRINSTSCQVVIAQSKKNVIEAIKKLNSQLFEGALGVVDNDCDSIDG